MWRPLEGTPRRAVDFVSTGSRPGWSCSARRRGSVAAPGHSKVFEGKHRAAPESRIRKCEAAKSVCYESVAAEFRAAERHRLDLPNKEIENAWFSASKGCEIIAALRKLW